MVSFNLTIGGVEPHHLSQCLDPEDDFDGVFFHPELPVHVNKQADLPDYLKQLVQERIGDIPKLTPFMFIRIAVETIIFHLAAEFTLNLKRPYLKNPDGCSVFRSELIAIDEALGSLASLPNGKEIWILSDRKKCNTTVIQLAKSGHTCSHPRVPRVHQAGLSRRSLAGVGLSESVRCHGRGLALVTNGSVQQQHVFKGSRKPLYRQC
ncbi:uncharacterized protein TNCV_846421 [Trichonephila clavipes]|nr:uncharacterized protein TNCV_846421 [Trichonephila clavipes]